MSSIDGKALTQRKVFVQACQMNPSLLHEPKLAFFKEYLLSLGATVSFTNLKIYCYYFRQCTSFCDILKRGRNAVKKKLYNQYYNRKRYLKNTEKRRKVAHICWFQMEQKIGDFWHGGRKRLNLKYCHFSFLIQAFDFL